MQWLNCGIWHGSVKSPPLGHVFSSRSPLPVYAFFLQYAWGFTSNSDEDYCGVTVSSYNKANKLKLNRHHVIHLVVCYICAK